MLQTTLETAFKAVKKLVEDFEGNKDFYLAPSYSEQSARHDFIDKFFIALGWDVNHETEKNPYEQEAKIELNVNVRGKKKRADYAFYLAPNFRDVVFYAEAKKPSVQMTNPDDYFQTIRYGYNSETPLAILTDFEQFHILDCRYAPSIETALDRFVRKYAYQDYLNKEKFAEIYYLFSREAIAGGSIEKRALELPRARGGAVQLGLFKGAYKPIDESLLDDLDGYRKTLAQAFKNGNPDLDHWALTEIVQRVIDRLVFIRFLEDKLIEPEDIISNFGTKSESVWKDFVSICRKLDKVYNGTIYKKHDILDAPDFSFDENAFADICEKLSSKNTPYDFDKIPIHILGSIYERFLGKVITTSAKRAKVEDKPEVKKAGGVFYTPEYIVRYIVENTIGKLTKDKTPEEISKMPFADIACGSGSFLLGAYDSLLRYHANYYNKNPKEATPRDCIEKDGALILSLHKKREILLNNIYGVDIDQQAVEVSQLSLYLKLLENETLGSTAASLRAESGETVLPPLNKNIQCGNSLVGPDFYQGVQEEMALYENKKEEVREINPFDWNARFSDIMKNGGYSTGAGQGFDAVIGNPPYVLIGADKPDEQSYFRDKYGFNIYKTNTYILFLEKGLSLLKKQGLLGYIIPKSLVFNTFFNETRRLLLSRYSILKIVEIREKVFLNAEVGDSILFFASVTNSSSKNMLNYYCVKNVFPVFSILNHHKNSQQNLLKNIAAKFYEDDIKIKVATKRLDEIAVISNGLNPGNIRHILLSNKKESVNYKKMVLGRDIQKYCLTWSGTWVNYDPSLKERVKITDIKSKVGMTAQTKVDFALRDPAIYNPNKILIRKTADHIIASFDSFGFYFDSLAYSLQLSDSNANSGLLMYLLGLLNSKLINNIHDGYSSNKGKVFAKVLAENLKQLPIRIVDLSKPSDKSRHDEIVSLVTSLLTLHQQLPLAHTDFDKERLTRHIESADHRIDELVYELYGLTDEEIKIVEGSVKEKK